MTTEPGALTVTSPAFVDGGTIPARYTCAGAGLSPPLAWIGVPDGAASVAIVVTDPDAPRGTFLHWLVYDVAAADGESPEGGLPPGAREGHNSARRPGWFAPCPPSGTHRYRFTVHVLDGPVHRGTSEHIRALIEHHTIASGTLTGLVSAS